MKPPILGGVQRVPAGFWDRLEPLLKSGGQAELAKLLNVSQPSVGRWLNHERIPDLLSLVSICRVFGVSADWLLGLSSAQEGSDDDLILVAERASVFGQPAVSIEERLRHVEEQLAKLTEADSS